MAEITDRESLEAWLATGPLGDDVPGRLIDDVLDFDAIRDLDALGTARKPRPPQDAVLIAARAALRVLPLTWPRRGENAQSHRADVTLPVFRAMAVASLAGRWSRLVTEVRAAARAAARAASDATIVYAAARASADAARAAASSVARSADVDAFAAAAADFAVRAADGAARASAEGDFSAADYSAADYAVADFVAVWAAVSSDATALEGGASHAKLGTARLWPGIPFEGGVTFTGGVTFSGMPEWATAGWRELKDHLLDAGEGWEVWTDWYDAILEGRPLDRDLELKKALIPDEVWKQGPAAVNAEIARLIAEHERRSRAGSTESVSDVPPGPDASDNARADRPSRPSQAQRAQARNAVVSRPFAIALQFADLHDRVEQEIAQRREERRNDPDAARYIEFLESLLPRLSTLSDAAAKVSAEQSEAEVETVIEEGWNLRNALEAHLNWIAGKEHAREIANGVLIGSLATGLIALGWASLPVSTAAIGLVCGRKLKTFFQKPSA